MNLTKGNKQVTTVVMRLVRDQPACVGTSDWGLEVLDDTAMLFGTDMFVMTTAAVVSMLLFASASITKRL